MKEMKEGGLVGKLKKVLKKLAAVVVIGGVLGISGNYLPLARAEEDTSRGPLWDLRTIFENYPNHNSFYTKENKIGEDVPVPTKLSVTSVSGGVGLGLEWSIYDETHGTTSNYWNLPLHAQRVAILRIKDGKVDALNNQMVPFEHITSGANNPERDSALFLQNYEQPPEGATGGTMREFRYRLVDKTITPKTKNVVYLIWSMYIISITTKISTTSIFPLNVDSNITIVNRFPRRETFPNSGQGQILTTPLYFTGSGSEQNICPSPNQELESNFKKARDSIIDLYQTTRALNQVIGSMTWIGGNWWTAVSDEVFGSLMNDPEKRRVADLLKSLFQSSQDSARQNLTNLTSSFVDILYETQTISPQKTKEEIYNELKQGINPIQIYDQLRGDQEIDECVNRFVRNFAKLAADFDITKSLGDFGQEQIPNELVLGKCGSPLEITKYIPCLLVVTLHGLARALFNFAMKLVQVSVGL